MFSAFFSLFRPPPVLLEAGSLEFPLKGIFGFPRVVQVIQGMLSSIGKGRDAFGGLG